MDLHKELEKLTASRERIVSEINMLEQNKQVLFQEALRIEGKVDLLNEFINTGQKEPDVIDSKESNKEVKK